MKCSHCPLKDLPECRGELHSRDCQLTDPSHPDYRPDWESRLRGEPVVVVEMPDLTVHFQTLPPAIETLHATRRVEACPHRSTEGCGCGGKARCALGRGRDGVVYPVDCIACDESRKEKPRIKVGIWCPCLNFGGAESWQLSLVKAVDPEIVEWVGLAVTYDQSPPRKMLKSFEDFMPVTFGCDAAHEVATKADIIIEWAIGDAASLLHGIDPKPIIIAVSHSPIESDWSRRVYAGSTGIDHWVAVSDLAIAAVPVESRAEATVIENAITESRLVAKRSRETMRTAWGVPEGSKVVGYLGRLSEEKNSASMASIAPYLPDEYHVVVVGFGWENGELNAAALTEPRLHLVGPDPDAGSVLGAFDTLIVPSDYESFGLTIAEGLFAGIPTISTEVGIAKLTPGLTRLIPVRPTGEQLAAAILADQDEGTAGRVESAKTWAKEHVSSARFGREWTDLIMSLSTARQT